MKSLLEQARDLRDTALILREQADSLEQLALFFGGPIQTEQPKAAPAVLQLPQPSEPAPHKKKATGASANARPLSDDDKAAIQKDWNQLGEHLRTKENRAALARKHRCSVIQICNLNRDAAYYQRISQKAAQLRSQSQTQ